MTHLEAIRTGLAMVRDALSAMEEEVLRREYGEDWWKTAVLQPLEQDGKRPYGWPDKGNAGDLDLQTALKLVGVYHWELFSDTFDWKGRERSLLQVMIAIRNQYEGHVTPNREKELTASVTDELLEGMARFVRLFDKKAARRLDTIEVSREEPMQTPPSAPEPRPAPAAPVRERAPIREIGELAPAADPEETVYRDTPLSEQEREKLEASGYRSLWDQEETEDTPITFYSRKPAPPPPPPPKPRTVLYQGVRVEEAPRAQDEQPRYSALNLQDLRRREQRRAASGTAKAPPAPQAKPEPRPAPKTASVQPEPKPEEFPDLEPIARAEKRRVPERAQRTASARRTRWEQEMETVDKPTRSGILSFLREEEGEQDDPRPERKPLLSMKQKMLLALFVVLGVIAGIGFVLLDLYLKKLWTG